MRCLLAWVQPAFEICSDRQKKRRHVSSSLTKSTRSDDRAVAERVDWIVAHLQRGAPRAKAWRYAAIATIASVLGGVFGYLIGAFLFDQVAQPILQFYGYDQQFERFAAWYNDWGVWIVLAAGVTPFPYKVITIASGATGLNFIVFMIASIVARGLRFVIVAGLLYWVGPPIRDFIERRLGLVFTVFMVLLIGGFVAARYLV